jgi:hypothetical protein
VTWKRAPKYGNKKVERAGRSFGSKLEASLFDHLRMREMAKEIADIKQQVNVHLTLAKILYQADYSYTVTSTGETEYAESKGMDTAVWRIKRRLWMYYGPGPLHIFKGSHSNLKFDETIVPKTTGEE